jgi:Gas vesicle synthesis protein GvpL/GvpF
MAKTPSAKKATKLARKAAAKPASKAAAKASKASKGKSNAASKVASKAAPAATRTPARATASSVARQGAVKSSAKVASKPAPGSNAKVRGAKPAPRSASKTATTTAAAKAPANTAAKAATPGVKRAPAEATLGIVRARETNPPAAAALATRSVSPSVAQSAGPVSDPNLNRALAAAVREEKSGLGKYVYCIVRATTPLSFGPIGIGGEPADVYTVNWRELAAVISDSPPGVQDPTRENVLAHQRVNETVMMEHTVLPMSFGTVFKTREDIIEFLRSAHEAFADVLNKMENKLEFGLKVLWDRDAVLLELEQDDEDIRRLKSEIASQKGSTYFARMQYGRLVDAALQARSERYVAEIFDGLRDVAVAARSNKPIGDRMIMNAAFLVSRPEEPAFDARVKALGARYDKLTFKYTGPWPPYNFVNIRLKLERA